MNPIVSRLIGCAHYNGYISCEHRKFQKTKMSATKGSSQSQPFLTWISQPN